MSNEKPITDGVYGFVSGTVTRRFRNDQAFEIEVKGRDKEGREHQYGDKWAVWEPLNVNVGDRVTVKGWLSTRAELFDGREGDKKATVKRSVNKPELVDVEAGRAPVADTWTQPAQAPAASWDTAQVGGGSYGDDTPF